MRLIAMVSQSLWEASSSLRRSRSINAFPSVAVLLGLLPWGFPMREALRKYPGATLFALVWLIYSVCPPFLSYDSYWSVATAVSLVESGSTRVDRFVAGAPTAADYGVECVPTVGPARLKYAAEGCRDGHWYSYFPLGTPVLVAPLFLVLKGAIALAGPLVPHSGFFARREVAAFFSGDLLNGRPLTELFCAAVIGAFTVWLQY